MKNLAESALGLGMALLCPAGSVFSASIPGLFGAGVLDDRSLAPGGGADLHYSLISTPAGTPGTAFVATAIDALYIPNGPNSKWLGPTPNGTPWAQPLGNYTYRLSFDLTGLDPATASMTARCAVDDHVYIYLNGLLVTNQGGCTSLDLFTVIGGFAPRINTLDFVVTNRLGPTGLRVDSLQGTALRYSPDLTIAVSQLELCWASSTGKVYQLQYRPTLATGAWTNWGEAFPGNDATICTNGPPGYYQLLTTGEVSTATETLVVPATNENGVWSSPLTNGQLYEFTASGTYVYSSGGQQADAEWIFWNPSQPSEYWIWGIVGGPFGETNDIMDLCINDKSVSWLGTADGVNYSPHTYSSATHTYKYSFRGTGAPVEFHIAELVPFGGDTTGDNSGSLTVSIAPVRSSLTIRVKTVRLSLFVKVSKTYQVESSTDLKTWTPHGATFVAESPTLDQDVEVLGGQQFFRLKELP